MFSSKVIRRELRMTIQGWKELIFCCRRRARDLKTGRWRFHGLKLLEEDRARMEKEMQKSWEADEAARSAVEVEVAALSGKTWCIKVSSRTTGAEFRARVARVAEMPRLEINLMCGMKPIVDDDVLLTGEHAERICGDPPQVQLIRVKRHFAVTGSSDKTLKLWDVDRSACMSSMAGHLERICCVAVDWESRRAITGSSDGFLKLWDLENAVCTETLGERRSSIRCLSVDWEGRRVLSSDILNLRLWDLDRAVCTAVLKGQYDLQCVAADWSSMLAISGSSDGGLLLWDLVLQQSTPAFQHMAWVACAVVDSNTRQALSGSIDGCLKLWDMDSMLCTRTIQGRWGDVRCVAVNWPSLRALTGTESGALKFWDLDTCECLWRFCHGNQGQLQCIGCIDVDWVSLRVITGAVNGEVKLWTLHGRPDVQIVGAGRGEVRSVSLAVGEPAPPPPAQPAVEPEQVEVQNDGEGELAAAEEGRVHVELVADGNTLPQPIEEGDVADPSQVEEQVVVDPPVPTVEAVHSSEPMASTAMNVVVVVEEDRTPAAQGSPENRPIHSDSSSNDKKPRNGSCLQLYCCFAGMRHLSKRQAKPVRAG
eukprot:TRINITY_DN75601_c0_g1_i1.p1 TRINITY_DN75601_c0_g1~~TRINITY_DN75601_c0_g1_i1.p1  ORF type:complete len:594 (+),score=76.52 TRINITY_DN75601_c0_g1_i1:105-1886(+)